MKSTEEPAQDLSEVDDPVRGGPRHRRLFNLAVAVWSTRAQRCIRVSDHRDLITRCLKQPDHVMSDHVMSDHVMSDRVMSDQVMSDHSDNFFEAMHAGWQQLSKSVPGSDRAAAIVSESQSNLDRALGHGREIQWLRRAAGTRANSVTVARGPA